jgi:hypothetical protein
MVKVINKCPCGNLASMAELRATEKGYTRIQYRMECRKCGRGDDGAWWETEAEALEAWKVRPKTGDAISSEAEEDEDG